VNIQELYHIHVYIYEIKKHHNIPVMKRPFNYLRHNLAFGKRGREHHSCDLSH